MKPLEIDPIIISVTQSEIDTNDPTLSGVKRRFKEAVVSPYFVNK